MKFNYLTFIKIFKILTIKGLGLGITVMDIIYAFGVVHLPNPSILDKPLEVLIALIVGIALMVVPLSFIEKMLEKLITKKIDDLDKE